MKIRNYVAGLILGLQIAGTNLASENKKLVAEDLTKLDALVEKECSIGPNKEAWPLNLKRRATFKINDNPYFHLLDGYTDVTRKWVAIRTNVEVFDANTMAECQNRVYERAGFTAEEVGNSLADLLGYELKIDYLNMPDDFGINTRLPGYYDPGVSSRQRNFENNQADMCLVYDKDDDEGVNPKTSSKILVPYLSRREGGEDEYPRLSGIIRIGYASNLEMAIDAVNNYRKESNGKIVKFGHKAADPLAEGVYVMNFDGRIYGLWLPSDFHVSEKGKQRGLLIDSYKGE